MSNCIFLAVSTNNWQSIAKYEKTEVNTVVYVSEIIKTKQGEPVF